MTGQDDPFAGLAPIGAPPPTAEDDGFPPAPSDADSPEARCVVFPLNDIGNGMRFVEHFGSDLFSVPRVGWFVWDGRIWAKDPDDIGVRRLAQRVSALIAREVRHLPGPAPEEQEMIAARPEIEADLARLKAKPRKDRSAADIADEIELSARLKQVRALEDDESGLIGQRLRHARNAGNSGPIANMISEAGVNLTRDLDMLDANAFDVNCQTGILRFHVSEDAEAGMSRVAEVELIPHAREHLVTKMMPVEYDPDARAPLFEAFLARIQPSAEMRGFLQRWLGLSMTAYTGEQKLAFLHGNGNNGKSVLVDLVARLMGDYAATAKIESITGKNRRGGGDATPDLVPLMGARMVRASEPDEGERLQEGLIKELTGGEPILVRALHSDFVEVRPVFKLTISGNHKPEIRGTDDGIWRRVLLVPFDVQVPKEERDRGLLDKLLAEGPGILNWLVEGLLAYLEGGLQEPDAVLDATREFREESDPVGAFLGECAVVTGDERDFMTARELIEAFNHWLDEKGETRWGGRTVSNHLSRKAARWRHPATGRSYIKGKSGVTGYRGIRLTDVFRTRFEAREQKAWTRASSFTTDREDG